MLRTYLPSREMTAESSQMHRQRQQQQWITPARYETYTSCFAASSKAQTDPGIGAWACLRKSFALQNRNHGWWCLWCKCVFHPCFKGAKCCHEINFRYSRSFVKTLSRISSTAYIYSVKMICPMCLRNQRFMTKDNIPYLLFFWINRGKVIYMIWTELTRMKSMMS